jgi:cell division protein FtsB
MAWGGPAFVITIIALSMGAWIITTWIRARYGYPVENEWGGTTAKAFVDLEEDYPDAVRQLTLLSSENEQLQGKITRLEDRIAVLERIATESNSRAAQLSDQIDRLR